MVVAKYGPEGQAGIKTRAFHRVLGQIATAVVVCAQCGGRGQKS